MSDNRHRKFLDEISRPIEILQEILQDSSKLEQKQAVDFAKSILSLKVSDQKDLKRNDMSRLIVNMVTISEVIMDWMVTLKLEK